jgi:hypothetical protein
MTALGTCTGLGLRAYFPLLGNHRPGEAAMDIINIWNTLLYVPMLLALSYFVAREGLSVWDLVGFDRAWLARDIALGLGPCFALFSRDGWWSTAPVERCSQHSAIHTPA